MAGLRLMTNPSFAGVCAFQEQRVLCKCCWLPVFVLSFEFVGSEDAEGFKVGIVRVRWGFWPVFGSGGQQ